MLEPQGQNGEATEDEAGSSDGQGSSYFSGEVLENAHSTPQSQVGHLLGLLLTFQDIRRTVLLQCGGQRWGDCCQVESGP